MEVSKIRQLFKKYMLGHSSGPENQFIEQWYQSFDAEALPEMDEAEQQHIKREMWLNIQPQIEVAKTFYLARGWRRAAAAVLLLAGAGAAWYLLNPHPRVTWTIYATRTGERKTIHLNDGSVVMLNAGTTIRIPDNLSKERKLDLVDGEAFFDVKTNPDVPFIVESGPLQTTVLGTSFNIAAYKGVHTLSIGVISGKVSISGKTSPAHILEQNQELVYNRSNGQIKVAPADEQLPGWKEGKLVFNDVTFHDMAVLMEKNFGITITTTQEHVRITRYTTELPTDMEPEKAAQVLAAIHHLKVRTINQHTVIYE
ncbi:FecR family protein [Chitinophaga ginsengisegetis]|uniref:FecR family protein n=1 Tax=Chitinophaga ginsengisegetis TaxID=393003 RepID=UPI000DBA638E|nr:FecR domain-containing protein [Chitinophaga ginsengisegetis]MDR6570517.1 ferric-dicitrate binding protein FerR (iron transport regulator) [Chitinophaga ginsengisegetis]MDR6650251.1 ferric-dicitrate binding protein FerR (iron transport regulator) [Chitinophaga ginsengisegetis]MDR6656630.1 ferric-dicitrate binding protein FerR (iron transport regulator) [Chitinophaga ginsengisegetis]